MATLNPGDEVIIPAPYWVSYPDMVLLADGTPHIVECSIENNFILQPDDLEKAITKNTKWIILNSPSNPTGAGYAWTDMKKITDVLLRHPHVWVMTDDMYEHLVYDNFKFCTPAEVAPQLYNRTLTVNGMSKAFCMTGWRIGYIMSSNLEAMQQVIKMQYYITACSNDAMQYAVLEALEKASDYPDILAKEFHARCNLIVDRLNAMPGLSLIHI